MSEEDPNILLLFAEAVASILGGEVRNPYVGCYWVIHFSKNIDEVIRFYDDNIIKIYKVLSGYTPHYFDICDPSTTPEAVAEKAMELERLKYE